MRLRIRGEKCRAVCEDCGKVVTATFEYRDVPFADGAGVARNILVAVCDICGGVVAIPPQSTPAIRRARERAVKPIEANLPAPFLELLDCAAYRINPRSTGEDRKALLAYYAFRMAEAEDAAARMVALVRRSREFAAAGGDVPRRRLSLKVAPAILAALDALKALANTSRTEVLTALIMQIGGDLVDPARPKRLAELADVLAVARG